MSSFTGSTLAWTLARTGNTASTFSAQTWEVRCGARIRVESFTCDIRAAGTYTLSIDGNVVATVAGVVAATNGVVFTLGTPLELAPGPHTFSLSCGSSVLWYIYSTTTLADGVPTGTGEKWLGWGQWQETASGFVPGSLSFKVDDDARLSYIEHTTISSGTFAAQTWTVTFDTDVTFDGMLKRQSLSDASGFSLQIDGATVATSGAKVANYEEMLVYAPASPVSLAAGAHTFKIIGSASRRYPYNSGTTATPTGDAHVTGWSVWSESTGNKVPARLFFRLPAAPSANAAASGSGTAAVSATPVGVASVGASGSGTGSVSATPVGITAAAASGAGVGSVSAYALGGAVPVDVNASGSGSTTVATAAVGITIAPAAGSGAVSVLASEVEFTSAGAAGTGTTEVVALPVLSVTADATGVGAASVVATEVTGPTGIDLSTFIDYYGSTGWDGTSLAPTVEGDYATFAFPLLVEDGTTYEFEIDYTALDPFGGGIAIYASAGLLPEDLDASNFYALADEAFTEDGTLTFTWGPGVEAYDLAMAAGEQFFWFSMYSASITAIRVAPALTPVVPPVVPPVAFPDTTNDAYKLTLGGWGVASWEPAPLPVPASLGTISQAVIKAIAYGPVTMDGSQPTFTTSEADAPRMRERVLFGGRDITYDRGVPLPEVEYELADLLLYGPGSMSLPAYMAAWEIGTTAAERWNAGRRVKVQLVDDTDPEHPTAAATIYKSFVMDPRVSGRNLSLELGGEAQGRLALRDSHVLFKRVHDIKRLLWAEFRDVGVRFPRLGEPGIGINSLNFSSDSKLAKVEELVARMVKKDGTQRAVLPDETGGYDVFDKDTTTAHFSVFVDDSFTVPDLDSDLAEKPNAVYATAIAPNGMRIDGAAVGGLIKTPAPDYPMADNSSFGEGTTNEDTDSGDGVSIIVNRLGSVGLLDIRDTPGGFDEDVADALAKLQRRAKITGPVGVMTPALWRALWDLDVTGRSPEWATIQPTAQDPATQRYTRAASGAPIGLNPDFDPDVIQVDESIDMGSGFRERQVQNWAETRVHHAGEKVWYGTITLTMGAVLAGQVEVGDTITSADLVDARLVQPGRHNLYVPNFDGGTLFGVSGVQRRGDSIVFTVDTRHRPAREVWERRQVRRETRNDPARRMMGNRQSTLSKDAVRGFISWGGVIDRNVPLERGWNVIEVVAGDYGTMAWIKTLVQTVEVDGGDIAITPHEYAVAVFGKPITAKKLNELIPNPLTISGTKMWETKKEQLDKYWLLYSAGTHEEPCGYSPGRKKWRSETGEEPNPAYDPDADDNESGTDDDETITVTTEESYGTITGQHVDEGTFPFVSENGATVFLAVRVSKPTTLRKGRVLWPVLEGGV